MKRRDLNTIDNLITAALIFLVVLILLVLVIVPTVAQAQWSSTADRTTWLGNVGATEDDVVTIPFSGGAGTEISSQYAAQGVLFTDLPPPEILNMVGLGNGKGLYRVGLSGPLTMQFPAGVVAVGIDYGQETQPRLEAVGYTSPTYVTAPAGQTRFMGVTNPQGISAIELWSAAGTAKMVTLYLVTGDIPPQGVVTTCTVGGAIPVAASLLDTTGAVLDTDELDYVNGEDCSELQAPSSTEWKVYYEVRVIVVPPSAP